jgi:hypothetical protein
VKMRERSEHGTEERNRPPVGSATPWQGANGSWDKTAM